MEPNILTLRIKPLDTLFFRNGKPFEMGDDSWAEGIFPPPPSVLYGAIRTWILANDKLTIDNIEKTADLEILEIYYNSNGQNILPLPLDYATKKEKSQNELYEEKQGNYIAVERLRFIENNYTSSADNSSLILYNNKDYILESISNVFINNNDLISYLKNDETVIYIKARSINNIIEPKIGITRNNETFTSEEGRLYRVGMNRPLNFSFIIRIKSKFISDSFSTLMKLGGENKIAIIDEFLKSKKGAKRLKIETNIKTKYLLVYLATPAIFINNNPNIENIIGVKAILKSKVIGKPINIGGFDMKNREPKPMYKAIPAGSIFLYELEKEIDIDNLQGISISDKMQQQGFGIAYFGTYKINKK